MYLLDTVAISETQKPSVNPALRAFYSGTDSGLLYVSVVSIGELHFGLNLLPPGKRRDAIQSWIKKTEAIYTNKILGVDEAIGRRWGEIRAELRSNGYTVALNDLLIAATAIHYDLTVVTRNIKVFAPAGCKVLNPWDAED